MRELELGELPTERLEQEMVDTAAGLWAATARWIDLVSEFDRREVWLTWGCRSAAEWLSWQCGVAPGTARDQVRVARTLRELPATRQAFASGALSYSKVRALGRVATPESEAELVVLARHATAAQLERLLATYRRLDAAQEKEAALAAFEARRLDEHNDDEGALIIRVRLTGDQADVVSEAIATKAQELWREERVVSAETPSAPTRTVPQRRADAFVELVTGGASADTEVVVHVDASAVVAQEGGGWTIGDSRAIDDATGRMLGCDAAIRAMVHGPNGEVLDLGRTMRLPNRAMRRAVERRDGGCVVPGCARKGRGWVDAHHIRWWGRDEGTTSLDNLALLCRFHHRLVHQGRLIIEMIDGTPVVRGGDERPLVQLTPTPTDVDDIRDTLDRLGVPTHLECPRGDGERIDYGLALDGLQSLLATDTR
ncbi:MAG TPA: DUF222 domain-containing protein [Acidimicrobiales bacterium]|nr:DUF222 domain-containing protein [Acidimicrobiales bacterium]